MTPLFALLLRFRVALAFLTRLPAGAQDGVGAAEVGRSTLAFPLVGALVGWMCARALQRLTDMGGSPLLAAAVAVAVLLLATGAMHQDALADAFDGLGGGFTREDALRIMRDSRVGVYGAAALFVALTLRLVCWSELAAVGAWPWVVTAATFARVPPVLLAWRLPYARRESGLGEAMTDHVGPFEAFGAVLIAAAIGVCAVGREDAAVVAGVAVVVTVMCARWFWRRVGGVTGDLMGASAELTELAILVSVVGVLGV